MALPGLPAALHTAAAAVVVAGLVYALVADGDAYRRAAPPALLGFLILTVAAARPGRGGPGRRVVGGGAAAVGSLALLLGGWANPLAGVFGLVLLAYGGYLAATRVDSPEEKPKDPRFRKGLFHRGGG